MPCAALAISDDTVLVHNGTTYQSKALLDCDGVTDALNYDVTGNNFSCRRLSLAALGGAPVNAAYLTNGANGILTAEVDITGTTALTWGGAHTWSALQVLNDAARVVETTASQADVQTVATFRRTSSGGVGQIGIGAAVQFEAEQADSNPALAGQVAGVLTSVTGAGVGDLVVYAQGGSGAVERLRAVGASARVDVTGSLLVSSSVQETVLSAVCPTPTANNVAYCTREDIDLGAGTATADCGLRWRLSDGTEGTIVVLVTDGGCP